MVYLENNRGIWTLVHVVNGKKSRKSLKTDDWCLAVQKAKLNYNTLLDGNSIAESFWKVYDLISARVSNATIEAYLRHWKTFMNYFGPKTDLKDINSQALQLWISYEAKRTSGTSASIVARSGKAVWGYMLNNGICNHYPWKGVKIPKSKSRDDFLTEDEVIRLLEISDDIPLHQGYLKLILRTGLRQGELYNLKWEDVTSAFIRIDGKSGYRRFPYWSSVKDTLNQIKGYMPKGKDARIFVMVTLDGIRPYSANYISKLVKKYLRRAGLRESLSVHSLRHTFASHLVQQGVPLTKVQRLLGHKSITTTERYAHLAPENIEEYTYF